MFIFGVRLSTHLSAPVALWVLGVTMLVGAVFWTTPHSVLVRLLITCYAILVGVCALFLLPQRQGSA